MTVNKNGGLKFRIVKRICGARYLSHSVRILFDRPSKTNLHGLMSQSTTAVILLNVAMLQEAVKRLGIDLEGPVGPKVTNIVSADRGDFAQHLSSWSVVLF